MRALDSLIRIGGSLMLLGATVSQSYAVDREVGSGKTFSSLQAAHDAASNGDRILVYSGTYTEDFIWTKSVDVIEADGETAIFRSSENPVGAPDEPIHCDGGTGTWDGIDYVQASYSNQGTMFYMKNSCTRTFRNFRITSDENPLTTPTENVKPFFCHDHPTVLVENVELDLPNISIGNAFHSQVGAQLTVNNCTGVIKADSFAWINTAGPDATTLSFSTCTLTNINATNRAFHCYDGTITAQDTTLRMQGAGNGSAVIEMIGSGALAGKAQLTRCLIDASTNTATNFSIANTQDSNSQLTMTNCAVLYRANGASVIPFLYDGGGTLALNHVTVSETGGSDQANGYAIHAPAGAAAFALSVRNSLFSLPNSTVGVLKLNGGSGTVQTNGTNLRFSGAVAAEELTGTLILGDPLLRPDHFHLNGLGPALGAGVNIGVTDDIDREPRSGSYDLGADQSGGTVTATHGWELYS